MELTRQVCTSYVGWNDHRSWFRDGSLHGWKTESKVGGRFRSASSISSSRLTLTSLISNPLFSKITAIYINQRNKNGRIYCRERSAGLKQQQAYAEGRGGVRGQHTKEATNSKLKKKSYSWTVHTALDFSLGSQKMT